jgi:DNA polymerase I-like protein with 3'-5' exonuclease and polymerase domains
LKYIDIETDGFLNDLTKIHCINGYCTETEKYYRFNAGHYTDLETGEETPCENSGSLEDGIKWLSTGDIVAHYGHGFDFPAIWKMYPEWKPEGQLIDSIAWTSVIWTKLKDNDLNALRKGKLPQSFLKGRLVGSHKLSAWGQRLGEYKGDFNPKDYGHTWKTIPFTKEMDEYCEQDVTVLKRLCELVQSKNYSQEALNLENSVKAIIARQERHGFYFNVKAAEKLTAELQKRAAELSKEAAEVFPPWYQDKAVFTPKVNNKKSGYTKGVELSKVELKVFNPGSRDHIADRFIKVLGWVPREFTPGGKPKVDEEVLSALPWPEAKKLTEYLMVAKRLGQLAEGRNAWLKMVKDDSRMYGRVNSNGAITGRMTHNSPNVAQTPASNAPYGSECRALFTVPDGMRLVGCDAEGLELRELAHYMAKYDGGEYMKAVTTGTKEDGTDAHTINMKALGLNKRDNAKTWFYAWIYGAGAYTLGQTVLEDFPDEKKERFNAKYPPGKARETQIVKFGKRSIAAIEGGLPALMKLVANAKAAHAKRGQVKSHDGRIIYTRAQHSALNTLLQGGGAVVMKKALVLLDDKLQESSFVPGVDYEFVANVHDEWQIEVTKPDNAKTIGEIAAWSIAEAGRFYNLRCPLEGAYEIGNTWCDTH